MGKAVTWVDTLVVVTLVEDEGRQPDPLLQRAA